ncbi:MAG: winged helix-turn-helix transcriptional regulator [Deltaproteobacteria bacterium]|jgi:ArsR family transcriptional regulator, arsenate/arsenite/antimonite-responsive transcriptional repressor|nr:winged helix-turn-helix transcriptional regulator [Deltaproteobacteria bacterium]
MKKQESKISLSNNELASICKALGHPARIMIIDYLKEVDECICGQIVDILPLAQSTVSQHLKALKKAGLIKGEVDGPRTCYCLNEETLKKFKQCVEKI